jgi:hypothetical protein
LKDLKKRTRVFQLIVFALITAMWCLTGYPVTFVTPVVWVGGFVAMLYCLFMAFIGDRIEYNAILAGHLSMSLRCRTTKEGGQEGGDQPKERES